jgi:hypothetical protein
LKPNDHIQRISSLFKIIEQYEDEHLSYLSMLESMVVDDPTLLWINLLLPSKHSDSKPTFNPTLNPNLLPIFNPTQFPNIDVNKLLTQHNFIASIYEYYYEESLDDELFSNPSVRHVSSPLRDSHLSPQMRHHSSASFRSPLSNHNLKSTSKDSTNENSSVELSWKLLVPSHTKLIICGVDLISLLLTVEKCCQEFYYVSNTLQDYCHAMSVLHDQFNQADEIAPIVDHIQMLKLDQQPLREAQDDLVFHHDQQKNSPYVPSQLEYATKRKSYPQSKLDTTMKYMNEHIDMTVEELMTRHQHVAVALEQLIGEQ